MSFTYVTGPGRCPGCGFHIPTQHHRARCPLNWCKLCGTTAAWPGSKFCPWCKAARDRAVRQQIKKLERP